MAIFYRYKNTLDDFIDSSNAKSLDWPRLIDKRLRNASRSEGSLTGLLEGDWLDKDISDRSFQLALKTGDSQMHQRHEVVLFNFKSGRSQYEKV